MQINNEVNSNFFNILFKTSNHAILILAKSDMQILDANTIALDLLKHTLEEIKKLTIFNIIITNNLKNILHNFSGEINYDGEVVDRTYDIIPVKITFNSITINNQTVIISTFLNLTSATCLEQELIKSNNRYAALVEDQVEFIYRFDKNGILTFVNKAYCDFFGKKCSEVLGHHYYDLLPNESKELVENSIRSLSATKLFNHYDNKVKLQDGTIKWIRWSDRIIFHKDNLTDFEYQSIGFDITDRKYLEQKLIRRNKNYKGILDSLQDGFYRIDKNCKIVCVSASTINILGFHTRFEILNKRLKDFFPNVTELKQILRKIKNADGKIYDQETKIFTKSNKIIDISFNAQLMYDKNKKIIGIQGMFRDITEMKQKVDEIIKLYQVVESSQNVIMIVDSDGSIEYANKSVRNFMKIPDYVKIEDVILGKKLKSFISFDPPLNFSTVCKKVETDGKWSGFAYCFCTYHDYEKLPIDIMFSKFVDQYGKFHVVASFHDISDRIRLEKKIEEQSKMYEELYGNMLTLVDKMDKFNNLKLNNINTLEEAFSKSINSIITLDGESVNASV